MQSPLTLAKQFSDRLKLPPQLQPHLPTVQLFGTGTALICHHRGLTEFTDRRICAATKTGTVAVTGEGLKITQMDHESLTVSGKIVGVSFSEGKVCSDI